MRRLVIYAYFSQVRRRVFDYARWVEVLSRVHAHEPGVRDPDCGAERVASDHGRDAGTAPERRPVPPAPCVGWVGLDSVPRQVRGTFVSQVLHFSGGRNPTLSLTPALPRPALPRPTPRAPNLCDYRRTLAGCYGKEELTNTPAVSHLPPATEE